VRVVGAQLAYAWLSDAFPMFGLRRRPYLVAFNLVASLCFVLTAFAVRSSAGILAVGVATQVCLCASEVMLDSLAVDIVARGGRGFPASAVLEQSHLHDLLLQGGGGAAAAAEAVGTATAGRWQPSHPHERPSFAPSPSPTRTLPTRRGPLSRRSTVGHIQATCLQARYAGTVVATLASIWLLAAGVRARTIIAATAVMPLVTAALGAFAVREVPVVRKGSLCGRVRPLRRAAGATAVRRGGYAQVGGDKTDGGGTMGGAGAGAGTTPSTTTNDNHNDNDNTVVRSAHAALSQPSVPQLLRQLLRAVFRGPHPLWPLLLLVFVLKAMPTTVAVLPSFYLEAVHMKGWELNVVTAVGSLGSLVGCALYARYLSRFRLWPILVCTTVIGSLGGCTQILLSLHTYDALHMSPVVLACLDGFIVGITNAVSYLPVVVLAAAAAPKGLEATAFAAMLSVTDASASVSDYLSALLGNVLHLSRRHWSPLTLMIIVCNVARVLPLLAMSPIRSDVSALIRPDGRRHDAVDDGGQRVAAPLSPSVVDTAAQGFHHGV